MPIARIRPNIVSMLTENPSAAIAAKAPMIVTGTVVAGNQDRAPVLEEEQDDDEDEDTGLEQGLVDLVDRLVDERGRVERDRIFQPFGERWGEPDHLGLDLLGDVQGVGPGKLEDADPRTGLPRISHPQSR